MLGLTWIAVAREAADTHGLWALTMDESSADVPL